MADILARDPLDDNDVSRRALIGIVTRNVIDADIDSNIWQTNLPHTIDLLNGHASKNQPIHMRHGKKPGRDEDRPVEIAPGKKHTKPARGASGRLSVSNSKRKMMSKRSSGDESYETNVRVMDRKRNL